MNQLPSKFLQWWPTIANVVCTCGYVLFAGFVSEPDLAKSVGLPGILCTALAHLFSTGMAKYVQNRCTNALPPAEDNDARTKQLIGALLAHGHGADDDKIIKAATDLREACK